MTRDKVLAMNEPQLTESIAVHVMKWRKSDDGHSWMDGDRVVAIVANWHPAKFIDAAWEVAEKMKLIVAPNNNGGWKAGRMDGARLEKHHVIWSERWVFAATAPEAICEAALLAVLGL